MDHSSSISVFSWRDYTGPKLRSYGKQTILVNTRTSTVSLTTILDEKTRSQWPHCWMNLEYLAARPGRMQDASVPAVPVHILVLLDRDTTMTKVGDGLAKAEEKVVSCVEALDLNSDLTLRSSK